MHVHLSAERAKNNKQWQLYRQTNNCAVNI